MGQVDSAIINSPVVNYTGEYDSSSQNGFAPFSTDLFQNVLNTFDHLYDFSRVSFEYSEIDFTVENLVDQLALGHELSKISQNLQFKQIYHLRNRFHQKYIQKQQFKVKSTDPLLVGVVDALNEGQLFKDVVKQFNISKNELRFVAV
ncbi:Hypothetical_protein [Hexamita inflata]|uniref:Hypothetical_protein n=1 Tax=Hexamita inflata TaxID=28002 RepID=A0ABP1J4T1_9EUKA